MLFILVCTAGAVVLNFDQARKQHGGYFKDIDLLLYSAGLSDFVYQYQEQDSSKLKQFPAEAQFSSQLTITKYKDTHKYIVTVFNPIKTIAIAFRGTTPSRQIFEQAFAQPMVSSALCQGCLVNAYYSLAWQNLSESVIQDYESIRQRVGRGYKILLVGHSMGGAIATVAAASLRKIYIQTEIDLVTFGQPRVGNVKWVQNLKAAVSKSYRVVQSNDIVPKFPSYTTQIAVKVSSYILKVSRQLAVDRLEQSKKLLSQLEDLFTNNYVHHGTSISIKYKYLFHPVLQVNDVAVFDDSPKAFMPLVRKFGDLKKYTVYSMVASTVVGLYQHRMAKYLSDLHLID